MPYQYKREPLSDDEVNRLTNACETFVEKFVILPLLNHCKGKFWGLSFPLTGHHMALAFMFILSYDNRQFLYQLVLKTRRCYLHRV